MDESAETVFPVFVAFVAAHRRSLIFRERASRDESSASGLCDRSPVIRWTLAARAGLPPGALPTAPFRNGSRSRSRVVSSDRRAFGQALRGASPAKGPAAWVFRSTVRRAARTLLDEP